MKKISNYEAMALLILTIAFSGCEAVGAIFKTGVWVGVIGVIVVIFIIIRLIAGRKN